MDIIYFVIQFLILYSFMIYPLVLVVLKNTIFKKEYIPDSFEDYCPSVTLIITAYNEDSVISKKIHNSLELNYPNDKLEIIVVSDDSSDETNEIVNAFKDKGINLLVVEGRRGKTACQNIAVKKSVGDILVFSDANAMYGKDAIKYLVQSFRDRKVGVVLGSREYIDKVNENKEGAYEKYENYIKNLESKSGGTIGAVGSIYALKKKDYIELNEDRISDISEPLLLSVLKGKTIIVNFDAKAVEENNNEIDTELKRKNRIVTRTLNTLWRDKYILLSSPFLMWKLVSHKVIRWFVFPFLIVLSTSPVFSDNIYFQVTGAVSFLYLVSGGGLYFYFVKNKSESKVIGVIIYSFVVFLGAALGVYNFLKGKNVLVWEVRS